MSSHRFLCILIIGYAPVFAAFEGLPVSGRTSALAHAVAAGDPASELIFVNPAAMKSSAQISMGQLFGMKDLGYVTLSAAKKNRVGCPGVGFQMLNHPLYKEWQILFAWSQPITDRFSAGLCLHTMGLQIERYGSTATWQIDIGWRYAVSDRLTAAGSVSNVNRQTIGRDKERLPQISRLGFRLVPVERCKIFIEVMKDARYPVEWKCAAACGVVRGFDVLFGFTQHPATITGGFDLHFKKFSIQYGMMNHPVLGFTHTYTIGLK